ncbi:dihydrolipoyl dehydrogenase [Alteribacter populi]|uniref:dihydrolipoyl dehydrogenase n=1 Tax=Alteribacter populi TaxID=2011011 RepID=UPI000BBA7633|nr:dihydrolipoyl dehydrogenase [Alteribacter populi]
MVVGEIVQDKDLIVIGGGPGGYSAAIRAAQIGLDTVLIEKENMGGVCLNEGCIPSKVFTHSASTFSITKSVSQFGIQTGEVTFELERMHEWKDKVVSGLKGGVEALCKANKIEVIKGEASFLSDDRIGVESGHQFDTYRFKQAIIATGSTLIHPKHIAIDHERILDTRSIFKINTVPEHLVVLGSDYISLEAAFGYMQLGASVSIILDEETDGFGFDLSIEKELQRVLKKRKIRVYKKSRVTQVTEIEKGVKIEIESQKGKEELTCSHFFAASKQEPNTADLGLDRAGVTLSPDGYIDVNQFAQTNVASIYAVGDVTPGPALAVKALKQGKVAAENCSGHLATFDLHFIPRVAHTNPPIASVGLTEAEAVTAGYDVKVSEFAAAGNGFASILGEKEGKTKIVVDQNTDMLLGFHTIGQGAVELISHGVTALEMVARDEDLSYPFYPHPSLNENWLEAVEGIKGRAIHMAPEKKKPVTNASK